MNDKTEIEDFFHLKDIVLCKIKSLNETRRVLVQTDSKELGVVLGRDQEGRKLLPLNRMQLICPETEETFLRKVALLERN